MKNPLKTPISFLKQLKQPAEVDLAVLDEAKKTSVERSAESATLPSAEDQLETLLRTIAAVATAVWRAKNKLDAEIDTVLPLELRNLPRYIHAAWYALEAGKIQVDDPKGRRYVPGMAVNTLTIQPLDNISCEEIYETIKPSVYFNDILIQRADVIIAKPTGETIQGAVSNDVDSELDSDKHKAPEQKGTRADGPYND
jgi:hypothetical protein